jgi:hypothetical protein
VAADLALDAALARYAPDQVVALAYHANIPQPDPMVVAGSDVRRNYYKVNGVPTFEVDGVETGAGGGGRDSAPTVYGWYTPVFGRELETPAKAAVAVRATSDGSKIKVTATVSKVSLGAADGAGASAKDLRLQVVLAERELHFTGENNIRAHTMVVRGVGGENATGFAVNASGDTTVEYTFDLAAIKDDVTKTIAAEIVKRRKQEETSGAAPRDYRAEGHAMTEINPNDLVVVAFVQDGDKHVLQAARADLAATKYTVSQVRTRISQAATESGFPASSLASSRAKSRRVKVHSNGRASVS